MFRRTSRISIPLAPHAVKHGMDGIETRPVTWVPQMSKVRHALWWDGLRNPYTAAYRERPWERTWGARPYLWGKNSKELLERKYHPAALKEILATVPKDFEVRDVPRPPGRIRAVSDGIVGRWYTNYWTLHSIKYQCLLAKVDWPFGERSRPRTNYDEPYFFVDFEETKMIRDYRSRWLNVNRNLVGMSKRIKENEEEVRFLKYKKQQDLYWSNRRVLLSRLKSLHQQGASVTMPIKSLKIRAFLGSSD